MNEIENALEAIDDQLEKIVDQLETLNMNLLAYWKGELGNNLHSEFVAIKAAMEKLSRHFEYL